MKKVITTCLLAVALLAGGITMDAKTTKKKAKASSSAVSKNAYGYPNPQGHTYKAVVNGNTITVKFNGSSSGTITTSDGHSAPYGWYQEKDCIMMGNFIFMISADGKELTGPGDVKYKMVK